MKTWGFCLAVVCLILVSRTESCNVEIVTTRTPTNITSPGYPFIAYPSNLNCWWKIDASDSENSVIVNVLDSYIESSTNCIYDSLSFYDGPDATGPSLGRLCGQNLTTVISSGSSIYIVFRTDGSDQFKGFLLEFYETTRCGGSLTVTSDETTFVGPGFPYQYLNNMNCTWFLTAENENDTIVAEFQELQVERGLTGCPYDYVSVFNDHQNQDEQFLGQFCGSSTPTLQSSRNKLRIDFKTDISRVGKGFSLNYKTVKAGDCNLTMPADSTPLYFVSPGYPDAYDNDLDCVWQIVSTGQQYIQVDVITSEIEGNYPLCSNDSVTVYEGRGLNAAELGKFCGNSTPSFRSNNRAMTVAFATDDEDEGIGFRIRYMSLDAPVSPSPDPRCGGRALSAEPLGQYLESPGYPVGYDNNEQCIWTITALSSNNYVKIDVINSTLEGGDKCEHDFVKAFDGSSVSSPLIKVWCGTMTPTLQSSGQAMTLVFKSDYSDTFRGFELKYAETSVFPTSSPNCGAAHLSASNVYQYLQSPGYPIAYQDNEQCTWTIESSLNRVIGIIVDDSHLEGGTGCPYDYVKVYDGNSTDSRMIRYWCDADTPTVQSSGQYMTLLFKTDATNTYKGFRLKYFEITVTPSPNPPCGISDHMALTTDQYLVSPGYPNAYPNNDQCIWTIRASTESFVVKIDVLDSVLEGGNNCPYDFVKVYDGSTNASRMIQVWCNTMTPTVQSTGRYMTLVFKTDSSNTYKGFRLKYFQTATSPTPVPQCGTSSLTAQTSYQYLQSPGYPNDYLNNDVCIWTIAASTSDDVVKIVVLDSILEGGSDCPYDFVKVYDGSSAASRMIQVWCGTMTPTVQSTGRYMTLMFQTDNSNTYKGFRLKYFQTATSPTPVPQCGTSSLTAQTSYQYLQSPGYPNDYPNNDQCVWTIGASTSDDVVKIVVLDSILEGGSDCPYDFVKVYDGSSTASQMIQVWCGTMTPTVQSTGRYMTLMFKTDNSNTYKGFRLKYLQTADSCGGDLSALSYNQDLTSPGYPNNYQNNMNCVWTITTDMSDIKIVVLDSDIESSSSCNYDYVEVYDGSSTENADVIGKFCGTQTPTYVSTGTTVTIKFHSDNSNTDTGFRLSYTGGSFPVCGDQDLVAYTYSSDLTSPNYPYNYPNNAECSWTLRTNFDDYVVNIDVISSDLEYSSSCSYDYYEFFDGSDDTFPSLGRYCGNSLPTRHSSGQYLYIKFHSDNSNTGTGFKMTYQAEPSDNFSDLDPPNIAAIVGGCIGGSVFLVVICSLIAAATKKKSRPVVNHARNDGIYSISQGPYETTITPATFQPPPPYSQVVSNPPYPQPVATSDTAPIVTQAPETTNQ